MLNHLILQKAGRVSWCPSSLEELFVVKALCLFSRAARLSPPFCLQLIWWLSAKQVFPISLSAYVSLKWCLSYSSFFTPALQGTHWFLQWLYVHHWEQQGPWPKSQAPVATVNVREVLIQFVSWLWGQLRLQNLGCTEVKGIMSIFVGSTKLSHSHRRLFQSGEQLNLNAFH